VSVGVLRAATTAGGADAADRPAARLTTPAFHPLAASASAAGSGGAISRGSVPAVTRLTSPVSPAGAPVSAAAGPGTMLACQTPVRRVYRRSRLFLLRNRV